MGTPADLPHGRLSPRTVHLCVDMQNLFLPDAPWAAPWMARVRPVVASVAGHDPARTVFTRFVPPQRPDQAEGRWRAYFEAWREVTRERAAPALIELVPELAEMVPPATVVDKPAYSPFHGSNLQRLLREREVDTLVVSGTETDVCVLGAVLDAIDLGYRVVLIEDAICSSADETHDALMTLYRSRFSLQLEVAPAAAVLAAWPS
jgi:nicotinamidase-related amidase